MSDQPACPNDCGWVNIYRTCQDGSRESALYEHLRTGCPKREDQP